MRVVPSKIRMTRRAMFPLVFTLALASSNFGPAAVWHPTASFRQSVVSACTNRGADFGKCFAGQMKAAGASADALAFTHAMNDDGYEPAGNRIETGGEERWSFRASGTGEYRLHFSYRRPWERTPLPQKAWKLWFEPSEATMEALTQSLIP